MFLSICAIASPLDSLRLEQKNGKKYIVHRVVSKETVQSLASYYQVEELAIMEVNPLITEGVKKGMVVRIPLNTQKYGNAEIKQIKVTLMLNISVIKIEFKYIKILIIKCRTPELLLYFIMLEEFCFNSLNNRGIILHPIQNLVLTKSIYYINNQAST